MKTGRRNAAFDGPFFKDSTRKLIANATKQCRTARIYIELINAAFLAAGGNPDEYRAGLERAVAKGMRLTISFP